jgi:hypothetical protein
MSRLTDNLDRAGRALRRSVARVRRGGVGPPGVTEAAHGTLRPRGPHGLVDQSVAALRAVVWIAAFVQAVFNEIRGRAPNVTANDTRAADEFGRPRACC